jgi:uncharacterized coiled-coil protein SlyX
MTPNQQKSLKISGVILLLVSVAFVSHYWGGDGPRRSIQGFQGTNTALAGQVTTLRGINTALADQVTTLQGTNTALADQVATLQGTINRLALQVATLTKEKGDLADQVGPLQALTNALSGQATALQTKITEWESYAKGLTNQIADLQSENARMAKLTNHPPVKAAGTNQLAGAPPNPTNTVSGRGLVSLGGGRSVAPTAPRGAKNTSFSTNGIAGGVPALFVNKRPDSVILIVRQIEGKGMYTFSLVLPPGTPRLFDLPVGKYLCSEEGQTDTATFEVESNPNHWEDVYGIPHHGGVVIKKKES